MSADQVPPVSDKKEPFVEEIKVQAHDLTETINDIIRKGAASRVTVTRGERTLLDLPLLIGAAGGVALAVYMPVISAIAGIAALLGGVTVRIEREEPPAS